MQHWIQYATPVDNAAVPKFHRRTWRSGGDRERVVGARVPGAVDAAGGGLARAADAAAAPADVPERGGDAQRARGLCV